jgi:hypothetical protein
MNKPLSETHPTLWKHQTVFQADFTEIKSNSEWIQSCTVDKAEHEAEVKKYYDLYKKEESRRLTQEIEHELIVAKLDSYWREQVEAEKKHVEEYTLRRVKEIYNELYKVEDEANVQWTLGFHAALYEIKKELGLDEKKVKE